MDCRFQCSLSKPCRKFQKPHHFQAGCNFKAGWRKERGDSRLASRTDSLVNSSGRLHFKKFEEMLKESQISQHIYAPTGLQSVHVIFAWCAFKGLSWRGFLCRTWLEGRFKKRSGGSCCFGPTRTWAVTVHSQIIHEHYSRLNSDSFQNSCASSHRWNI